MAALAVGLVLTAGGSAVGQDAQSVASTRAERCAALRAAAPGELARWLASSNGVSLVEATAVVAKATAESCGP